MKAHQLFPMAPQEAGFDPDGLARVEAVMRQGLDDVFPAAILLVARRGGVVFHRAYGCLDPETRRRPTQTDSLFDLASVTKLFTATAFMTLVEAGRVALDTPVADVLPEFGGLRPIGPTEDPLTKVPVAVEPALAGQEVDARQVTFWHLLTHTSGLAAWRSLYREDGEEGDAVPLPHQVSVEAGVGEADVVVGITASGGAPWVLGVIAEAQRRGAGTVGLTCNPDSPLVRQAGVAIVPIVGPEVIAGSSRMKAGTAQKMVLNMLSTATMIRLGKVYGNLMVDVQPTNAKLRRRAVHILQEAAGADPETARRTLETTDYEVKPALVMLLTGVRVDEARRRLGEVEGFVHWAVEGGGESQ